METNEGEKSFVGREICGDDQTNGTSIELNEDEVEKESWLANRRCYRFIVGSKSVKEVLCGEAVLQEPHLRPIFVGEGGGGGHTVGVEA